MNTSRIDYLNIGLMVISLILAVKLPFEVFLLAYAVLGPLHYLTEIGWLHKRNYFSHGKYDWLILCLFCAAEFVTLLLYEAKKHDSLLPMMESFKNGSFSFVYNFFANNSSAFIFMAFAAALAIAVFKNPYIRYGSIILAVIPAYFLDKLDVFTIIFGVFLPTIIHVCIFTGLFMLYGAMKSKAFSGYLSVGVFILCILLIFNIQIDPKAYRPGQYWIDSFIQSSFQGLNYSLWEVIAPGSEKQFALFSKTGLKIQAFIAFAYTYHYLNWFSKTEVIKWHNVPRKYLIFTFVMWVVSVSLYFYNYRTGLVALFFLSVLHVFLEFPLNFQSFIGIGKETGALFKKSSKVSTIN